MYEFKYQNVADMPIDTIKEKLDYLVVSLQNKLNNQINLSLLDQIELMKAIEHVKTGFNIALDMKTLGESEFDYATIDKLIENSKQLKKPLRFYVTGSSKFGNETDSVRMLFSQKTLDNLIDLNNYLVDKDEDGLFFMEDVHYPEASWSFEEVLSANSQVEAIVDYINEKQFTPFEAAAFIHQYITTQFSYKENEDDIMSPRSLIGVLNTDDIVCVGYSTLTKAIIDRLNMPGLQCSTFASKITPSGENKAIEGIDLDAPFTGHMQNLVIIDDPIYKVKGNYITDACWDSKSASFPNGKGLANFMYPVEDLLHYKGIGFDQFHKEVDKLFKTLGFLNRKIDPYALPIISENIDKSQPIDYEKYRAVLKGVFKKMSPNESLEKIEDKVNQTMNVTEAVAYLIFDDKALGSIAKKANKTMSESSKEENLETSSGMGLE